MTVTSRKPHKSPARDGGPGTRSHCSASDSDFYSSLAHLRHEDHLSWRMGLDSQDKRKESTKEERQHFNVVEPLTVIPRIHVNPSLRQHHLAYKRTSAMRNAASVSSLPSYLTDTSSSPGADDSSSQRQPVSSASGDGAPNERSFITVNYLSTRTLLGRKRSFRGKKVMRVTAATDQEERQDGKGGVHMSSRAHESPKRKVNTTPRPTDLRVTKHNGNTATLFWMPGQDTSPTTAHTTNIQGYTVYINDEVEAFVEGKHNCSLELVELESGKIYRASVTARGRDALESAGSTPLQFVMPNRRSYAPSSQGPSKGGNLSVSMPTLLDDQDDAQSACSFETNYSLSPDDGQYDTHYRHAVHSASHCGDEDRSLQSAWRESTVSSGLGTSTPSSPDSPKPGYSNHRSYEPSTEYSPGKNHFHFLNVPVFNPVQSRPVSAEPVFNMHAMTSSSPIGRSRLTSEPQLPRPSSTPAIRRKVASYCTAV